MLTNELKHVSLAEMCIHKIKYKHLPPFGYAIMIYGFT